MYIHTSEKRFKCKCGCAYTHRTGLNNHIKLKHPDEDRNKCIAIVPYLRQRVVKQTHKGDLNFRCQFCPFECSDSNQLRVHEMTHIDKKEENTSSGVGNVPSYVEPSKIEKEYKHSCAYCSYRCNNKSYMKVHEMRHTGEKQFHCEYCDYRCHTKSDLTTHQTAKHKDTNLKMGVKEYAKKNEEQNIHRCSTCEAAFTRKVTFIKHMKSVHNHLGDRKCDQCPYRSWRACLLRLHVKETHKGERNFRCQFCPFKCSKSGQLRVHEMIHTGEKPFQCEQCSKRFANKEYLKKHQAVKHDGEKPFQCELCPKRFAVKFLLGRHVVFSHTMKKTLKCEFCDYTCKAKQALKVHTRTHTGEKPYQCDVCSKAFAVPNHMKRHMLIHTGEKPFSCNVCKQSFRHLQAMKLHEKTHKE